MTATFRRSTAIASVHANHLEVWNRVLSFVLMDIVTTNLRVHCTRAIGVVLLVAPRDCQTAQTYSALEIFGWPLRLHRIAWERDNFDGRAQ